MSASNSPELRGIPIGPELDLVPLPKDMLLAILAVLEALKRQGGAA